MSSDVAGARKGGATRRRGSPSPSGRGARGRGARSEVDDVERGRSVVCAARGGAGDPPPWRRSDSDSSLNNRSVKQEGQFDVSSEEADRERQVRGGVGPSLAPSSSPTNVPSCPPSSSPTSSPTAGPSPAPTDGAFAWADAIEHKWNEIEFGGGASSSASASLSMSIIMRSFAAYIESMSLSWAGVDAFEDESVSLSAYKAPVCCS